MLLTYQQDSLIHNFVLQQFYKCIIKKESLSSCFFWYGIKLVNKFLVRKVAGLVFLTEIKSKLQKYK